MANTIITKNSATATAIPTAGQLVQGELAVNVTDKRLFTENSGGTVVELGTNPSQLNLADNAKANFGAGSDLQIYHTGSHSWVQDAGTGNLYIAGEQLWLTNSDNTKQFLKGDSTGRVDLYYNTSVKLATTDTGIDVTGTVVADGLEVNGGTTNRVASFISTDASGLIEFADNATTNRPAIGAEGNDLALSTNGEKVRITSAGNVGIGTSIPDSFWGQANKLVVGGSGNQGISIYGTSTGRLAFVDTTTGNPGLDNGGLISYIHADDQFLFRVAGTDRVTIDSAGIDVTGTVVADGLTINNTAPYITFKDTDTTDNVTGYLDFRTSANVQKGFVGFNGAGDFELNNLNNNRINFSTTNVKRMDINAIGDISFYEDTGSTAKMVWDASDESLLLSKSGGLGLQVGANDGSLAGAEFRYSTIPAYITSSVASGPITGHATFSINQYDNTEGTADSWSSPSNASYNSAAVQLTSTTGGSEIRFFTEAGEAGIDQKMVIDSSGNLNIGNSGNFGGKVSLAFNPATQHGIILAVSSGTFTNNYIAFQNSGGSKIGSISSNNSSVAYNTSSDYRLKEDWVAVADASTRVNALKPINFAWKATGERVDGFLAHELAEVVPEAVTGTKDAMRDEEYEVSPAVEATYDEEGNELTPAVEAVMGTRSVPDYQGIDQSKLVPLLTAALQEALAKIESLEARLDAANI